jgi:periplasmic copper chaperone A
MNRIPKTLAALALATCALAALAHSYAVGPIQIGHPWARATLAVQTAGGAYLKLQNTGSTPDRLVSASTPVAQRVELHSMAMDGNIMRMREIDAIDIPPGQVVELKPGSLHLMLVGLKAPLKQDSKVPLTLKFEKAGEVQVELKVDAMGAGAPAGEQQGGHKH